MTLRSPKIIFLVVTLLAMMLAACAPDNLDITPTRTPTSTPEPTPTRTPTPTPDPDATPEAAPTEASSEGGEDTTAGDDTTDGDSAAASDDPLEAILAAFQTNWTAGGGQWRRSANETTDEDVTRRDEPGGRTVKVYYEQADGSFAEITIGLFETPEAAQAYFDVVAERTRTLENAESREGFPEPNMFGGGLYGQDALTITGNYVVRVSVPRFNSGAGDPLSPLLRATLRIVEEATGASA